MAEPLGLDLWIGLPAAAHRRVADIKRPTALPELGALTELKRAAFFKPWSSPLGRDLAAWREAEIPSANGHTTAEALARLASVMACDGQLGDRLVLEPGIAAEMMAERIRGQDLVLPYEVSWGAGLLRNDPVMIYGPGRHTAGHSGWGGSCLMAEPERRLSAAYVMNRQSGWLIGDPRSRRLIDAIYEGL